MAQFVTGYLQRAIPFDVGVVGPIAAGTAITTANRKTAILRGDFVKLTPATATVPAYITKATEAEVTAKTATHIVALTDQTVGSGYVPTDVADYRASDLTGATKATALIAGDEALVKKVALWPIWDWNDIRADADKLDQKA